MGHPGQLDVVEIAALAGDEPRVLDPLDRRRRGRRWASVAIAVLLSARRQAGVAAAVVGAVAPARIVAAASRIAATMLW